MIRSASLADGNSVRAQKAIIGGCGYRQPRIDQGNDLKLPEAELDEPSLGLGAEPAEDFAKDQVADQQRRFRHQRAQLQNRLRR